MIASMTGYGKSEISTDSFKITVEIKSINSKQLDLTLRLPSIFKSLESEIRNKLSAMLERGKIEVSVNYENLRGSSSAKLNLPVINDYKQQIEALVKDINLPQPSDLLSLIMRMPDTITIASIESDDTENEALVTNVMTAANNLMDSRIKEGEGLYKFFFDKLSRISEYLRLTEKFEPQRVIKIREKLDNQLSRLTGIEIDKGRLEQELIFYIEKLDVTEEKQRLRSHITYFEETLGEPDETIVSGKGKKLGFISQEIGREINTLGSKSNDADMQKLVVMMKDELEQIKEQVLNVL